MKMYHMCTTKLCLQIEDYMQHLESWKGFDVFHLGKLTKGRALSTVVYYSLQRYDLLRIFGIVEQTLFNFLAVRGASSPWLVHCVFMAAGPLLNCNFTQSHVKQPHAHIAE